MVTIKDIAIWFLLGTLLMSVIMAWVLFIFSKIKNALLEIILYIPIILFLGAIAHFALKYLVLLRLIK